MLTILHKWLEAAAMVLHRFPFSELESVTQNICHAFMSILRGWGLLTPCNAIIHLCHHLCTYIKTIPYTKHCATVEHSFVKPQSKPHHARNLLQVNSTSREWRKHSALGLEASYPATKGHVYPQCFAQNGHRTSNKTIHITNTKHGGYLTNSDLEMAGLLLMWLVMEDVCDITTGTHVTLFSDILPMVNWICHLAAQGLQVTGQLIHTLALQHKLHQVSPLTPLK